MAQTGDQHMSQPTRREVLGTFSVATVGLALGGKIALGEDEKGKKGHNYVLPPLPYDYAALEPYIDAKTMQIHHDKHHAAYVENLNKALQGKHELMQLSLEELLSKLDEVPEEIRTAVNNNGGGHSNHMIFWEIMGPSGQGGGAEPEGEIADAIKSAFGEFKTFKDKLNEAAMKRFGSGWGWLIFDKNGKLAVESFANQDSPYTKGAKPIMG